MVEVLTDKCSVLTSNSRPDIDLEQGIDVRLPVTSKEELAEIEHRLRCEPVFKKKLVIFFNMRSSNKYFLKKKLLSY